MTEREEAPPAPAGPAPQAAPRRLVFVGGGTGGHLYPALTLARGWRLRHPADEILFIGTRRGLEADLVPREGFRLVTLPVRGLPRRPSPAAVAACWQAAAAVFTARRLLAHFRPALVVATGGYVCGPVLLAAATLGQPILLQEQNARPGLTSRLTARLARGIALGYEEAREGLPRAARARARVTGNPIRDEVVTVPRLVGLRRFDLDPARQTVVVFGASQGAASINRAVLGALPELLARRELQLLLATGTTGFPTVRERLVHLGFRGDDTGIRCGNVQIVPYLYDMPAALAAADLVVCRAGALTLAEVTARGVPAILVPYPHAAEDHQTLNARVLVLRGAAELIPDRELTSERLVQAILSLLANQRRRSAMARAALALGKPRAAEAILDWMEELLART